MLKVLEVVDNKVRLADAEGRDVIEAIIVDEETKTQVGAVSIFTTTQTHTLSFN